MMMTIADVIKQLVEAHEDGKDINLNKYVFISVDFQLLGIYFNLTTHHRLSLQSHAMFIETDVVCWLYTCHLYDL